MPVVEIPGGSEWRFELAPQALVHLTVTEGVGEVFGTELATKVRYTMVGAKSCVYLPSGATVEYEGELASDYVLGDLAVPYIANLHFVLHRLRATEPAGPRVLLLGGHDCGKTLVAKTLVAYANKMGHLPVYLGLDPREGAFAVPGAILATPISDILDVQTGFGLSVTLNVSRTHPKQPAVRWVGVETPAENLSAYRHQCLKLAVVAGLRMEQDPLVKRSGCVVDTPALGVRDMALIDDLIADYAILHVVVIGNERFYVEVARQYGTRATVLKMAKSGGCVDRDDVYIRALQHQTIKDYFYGSPEPLEPYTSTLDYTALKVYNVPVQDLPGDEPAQLVEVQALTLQNTILAVLFVANDKEASAQRAVDSPTMGFAYVSDADDAKQKLRVLGPVPAKFPLNVCLIGTIRYHE